MASAGGWHFTHHALERAVDMAIDPEVIYGILTSPACTTPGGPEHPAGCQIWATGKVAIVVRPDDRVVVTVLWRGKDYVRGEDEEFFRD